jgi:hypothetical protein
MSPSHSPYDPLSMEFQAPTKGPQTFEFELFLRWEKLRLLYNAILFVEAALLLLPLTAPEERVGVVLVTLPILCLLANIGFCVGPVVNGYFALAGHRDWPPTVVLFVLGTMLAMLLALVSVFWLGGDYAVSIID